MAAGGYRVGAGRPVGAKGKAKDNVSKKKAELTDSLSDDDNKIIEAENLNPLAYMLKVMNDGNADKDRRDRMAIAAAPFIHSRKGEGLGKKDEASERAKTAGAGRFSASAPPNLAVVKK